MKNGEFIGQTAKEISPEELDTVIEMIKASSFASVLFENNVIINLLF